MPLFLSVFNMACRTSIGLIDLIGNEIQTKQLFEFFLFEKAIYELGYEINNRPEWIAIPLKGINYLLETQFND
jgi:predicted trehalose synthase